MTAVTLEKSDSTGYRRFTTRGHSGYAAAGEDIVCAAVSASTELVITILERFSVGLHMTVDRKKALVTVEIDESEQNRLLRDTIIKVLDGYADYLSQVANEYPDYVKVN